MLFFSNSNNASLISNNLKKGKIKQIYKGIYIDINSNSEKSIRDKIIPIMSHLKIDGIISYDSALSVDGFNNNNTIWIAGNTAREILLDNMKIVVIKSNNKEKNDFGTNRIENTLVKVPNIYRSVLQNFSIRKVDFFRINKQLAFEKLIKEFNKVNSWEIIQNNLLLHAKELDYLKEYEELMKDINEYKETKSMEFLDLKRVNMFDNFLNDLNLFEFPKFEKINIDDVNFCQNMAFLESYFSNYIEGTEFEVKEAYSIVFDPKVHYVRYKDGHDIKKSYEIMLNNIQNPIEFKNSNHYISTIKKWHFEMMNHRSDDLIVGDFKKKNNRAGNTNFVHYSKVEEMLKYSFELSTKILDPIKKGIFLKLTFTEIHPFEDGNGRISRIILNNFLSIQKQKRIIIPNVFREDYILGLKAFSNGYNNIPILKVFSRALLITNEIPFDVHIDDLISFLNDNSAFCTPNESVWGVKNPKFNIEETNQVSIFNSFVKKNKF